MTAFAEAIAARDKACAGSLEEFRAYARAQGQVMHPEAEEIAYHKCRTAIRTLPENIRLASDRWLRSRNYESWL